MAVREYLITFDQHHPEQVVAIEASILRTRGADVPPEVVAQYQHIRDDAGETLGAFTHFYAKTDAQAWLDLASSHTPAVVDALPTSKAQVQAIVDMWTEFGNFWRCLNVCPYGWKPFRLACEAAWGKPDRGNMGINSKWRRDAAREFDQWRSRSGSDLYPSGIVQFGPIGNWRRGPACEHAYYGFGDCMAPTGDLHRVWLQNDGTMRGNRVFWPDVPNEISSAFPNAYLCGVDRVGSSTPVYVAPGSNPALYQGWRCHAAAYDERGGPWSPEENMTNIGYLPPMLWYAELLYPLLDQLRSMTPEQVIVAVRMDVAKKNSAVANAVGVPLDQLPLAANADLTEAHQKAAEGIQGVTGGASSLVLAGLRAVPGVGAFLGVSLAVMNALVEIFGTAVARYLDVFGRDEPVFERFPIADTGGMTPDAAIELLETTVMPEPRRYTFAVALEHLTPSSHVEVRDTRRGEWTDVTMPGEWNGDETVWTLAPRQYPTGFALKMKYPDGTERVIERIDPTEDADFMADRSVLRVDAKHPPSLLTGMLPLVEVHRPPRPVVRPPPKKPFPKAAVAVAALSFALLAWGVLSNQGSRHERQRHPE